MFDSPCDETIMCAQVSERMGAESRRDDVRSNPGPI